MKVAQLGVASSLMLKGIGFDPEVNTTLNISEQHHPKCASTMINNFGEIVSSLLTADHICRRSEDESWKGLLTYLENKDQNLFILILSLILQIRSQG